MSGLSAYGKGCTSMDRAITIFQEKEEEITNNSSHNSLANHLLEVLI